MLKITPYAVEMSAKVYSRSIWALRKRTTSDSDTPLQSDVSVEYSLSNWEHRPVVSPVNKRYRGHLFMLFSAHACILQWTVTSFMGSESLVESDVYQGGVVSAPIHMTLHKVSC